MRSASSGAEARLEARDAVVVFDRTRTRADQRSSRVVTSGELEERLTSPDITTGRARRCLVEPPVTPSIAARSGDRPSIHRRTRCRATSHGARDSTLRFPEVSAALLLRRPGAARRWPCSRMRARHGSPASGDDDRVRAEAAGPDAGRRRSWSTMPWMAVWSELRHRVLRRRRRGHRRRRMSSSRTAPEKLETKSSTSGTDDSARHARIACVQLVRPRRGERVLVRREADEAGRDPARIERAWHRRDPSPAEAHRAREGSLSPHAARRRAPRRRSGGHELVKRRTRSAAAAEGRADWLERCRIDARRRSRSRSRAESQRRLPVWSKAKRRQRGAPRRARRRCGGTPACARPRKPSRTASTSRLSDRDAFEESANRPRGQDVGREAGTRARAVEAARVDVRRRVANADPVPQ